MNILIIPHLPTYQSRGYQLAKELAEKNKVIFILWDMPYPFSFRGIIRNIFTSFHYQAVQKDDINIIKVRRFPFIFPPINSFLFKRQIKKIFYKNNIDIIYSQSYFSETEPPTDLPFVYDIVDDHEAYNDIYGSRLYNFVFKILKVHNTIKNQIKNSRSVIVVSEPLKSLALNYGAKEVTVIPNGVEDEIFKIRPQKGKKNSLIYVTHFGKWAMIDELITAVASLEKKLPNIHLTLVGDGIEYSRIRSRIIRENLQNLITLKGRIDDRITLFHEINKHELGINLSEINRFRNAASPMKVMEYTALGKKILSTRLKSVETLGLSNIVYYDLNQNLARIVLIAIDKNIFPKKTRSKAKKYALYTISGNIKRILRPILRYE